MIAISILSYNHKDLLRECLLSLRNQTDRDFVLYIVDNASTDGTSKMLKSEFPEVKLLQFEKNTGFAYPHNVVYALAKQEHPETDYFMPLNDDTKLDPNFLTEMVACAGRHPEAAAIQSKLINYYDKNIIDCAGILIHQDMSAINRGQKEPDTGQFEREEEIFGASGSAPLYRVSALEKVLLPTSLEIIAKWGMPIVGARQRHAQETRQCLVFTDIFDSDYMYYYEDVDLAWRLRLAGYSAWYTPMAVMWHVHSATGINSSPLKAFHIHRNLYYNMFKNLPGWMLVRALAYMPLRYFMSVVSLLRGKGNSARFAKNPDRQESILSVVGRTWWQTLVNLPLLLRKRKLIAKTKTVTNREISRWFKKYPASWNKIIFG